MDNQTPPMPPTPDEEWAKKLGLDFDPKKAEENQQTPPPAPEPPQYNNFNNPGQPAPQMNPLQTPQQPEPMPDTYMVWSVISLVCCCFPASVVAIIYSAQVSSKYYAGDSEGAKRCSDRAQIWIIVSIVLGIIGMALYIPLTLFTAS